jgi:hypothetical protein
VFNVLPAVFPDTAYFYTIAGNTGTYCLGPNDLKGNIQSAQILQNASQGIAFLNGDTCLDYTASPGASGLDMVKVVTCDAGVPTRCDTQVFVFAITPSITSDTTSISLFQGGLYEACLNSTNLLGDVRNSAILRYGNLGSLSLNDTCIRYQADTLSYGLDTFSLVLCDSFTPVVCDTFTFVATIHLKTSIDTPTLTAYANQINQLCFGSDELSNYQGGGQLIQAAANGQVAFVNDTCIEYQADSNFTGPDSFWITLCEQQQIKGCDTLLVRVNVLPLTQTKTIDLSIPNDSAFSFCYDFENLLGNVDSSFVIYAGNQLVQITGINCLQYRPDSISTDTDTIWFVGCRNTAPKTCDTLMLILRLYNPATSLPEIPAAAQKELIVFGSYPNPFRNVFILQYYVANTEPMFVEITDMNGRLVYEKAISHQRNGLHYARLYAEGLASGQYILHLKTENDAYRKRIVKVE